LPAPAAAEAPAPGLRPKPTVHPFGPAVLSAMRVAVTAPELDVVPLADTHSPTFRAAEVTLAVRVTVVVEVVVTVSVLACWLPRAIVRIVTVEPLTAVTVPVAKSPMRTRLPAVPPLGAPEGRTEPLARPPPKPPKPPPPPPGPAVQVPLADGLTVSVVAVNDVLGALGLAEAEVVAVAPTAVTQSPILIALSTAFCDWVKRVLALKMTLTWPVAGSCTSMVSPVMAAARP
jgi:hypothetical protein